MPATTRSDSTSKNLSLPIYCLATGFSVAAVVYHQTLVKQIAGDLGVSSADLWVLSVATQAGYGTGLVLGLPLGDKFAPHRLIPSIVLALGMALLLLSRASSVEFMCILDYAIGVLSIGGQLLIAHTAKTASPVDRTRLVGVLLSALFGGLLLSRVLPGWIAEHIGWRTFYLSAGLATCAIALALSLTVRKGQPTNKIGYAALVRSLANLWQSHAELRRVALAGACFFAALNGIWANLASLIQDTLHWSSGEVGLLAFTSLAGLRAPNLVRQLQKRRSWSATIMLLGGCLTVASILGFLVGSTTIMIILFLLTVDLTVRSIHVVSQGRVLGIDPAAASRLNGLYMTVYFLGAAVGSWLGGVTSHLFGWSGMFLLPGACAIGGMLLLSWSIPQPMADSPGAAD